MTDKSLCCAMMAEMCALIAPIFNDSMRTDAEVSALAASMLTVGSDIVAEYASATRIGAADRWRQWASGMLTEAATMTPEKIGLKREGEVRA